MFPRVSCFQHTSLGIRVSPHMQSIVGRYLFSDKQTENLLKETFRYLLEYTVQDTCLNIQFRISVLSCQIMELKPCIIAMIQLFKVAVRKPLSSDNLPLYRTQPCNNTPEKTGILQLLLSVRLLMYFQKNHSLLLFSFSRGSMIVNKQACMSSALISDMQISKKRILPAVQQKILSFYHQIMFLCNYQYR